MKKVMVVACNMGGNIGYINLSRFFKNKNRSKIRILKTIYTPPNSLNGSSSVPEHTLPTSTSVECAQEHGTYELGGV